MGTRVQPFDIGCEPSPSIPAETVLADGWCTYLLFFAVSQTVGESGYLTDLGVAVLNCKGCVAFKFGYPNDEGWPEHKLSEFGLLQFKTSVLEVIESAWASELEREQSASARRIWGNRGVDHASTPGHTSRHFVLLLKEKTFECVASSIVVERFCESFDEAIAYVVSMLNEN